MCLNSLMCLSLFIWEQDWLKEDSRPKYDSRSIDYLDLDPSILWICSSIQPLSCSNLWQLTPSFCSSGSGPRSRRCPCPGSCPWTCRTPHSHWCAASRQSQTCPKNKFSNQMKRGTLEVRMPKLERQDHVFLQKHIMLTRVPKMRAPK